MASNINIIRDDSWPQGLILYTGILELDSSRKLFNHIDQLEWSEVLSRKVQHYGYYYTYNIKEPQTQILEKTTSPPKVLKCIADALFNLGILEDYPNQIIVNRYLPGEGIGKHRDHYPIFGKDVATLSLGSDIDMQFEPYKNMAEGDMLNVRLPVGSILVFGGDARMKWSHEIKKRKTDLVNNKKITRGVRISVTFRHVNDEFIGK